MKASELTFSLPDQISDLPQGMVRLLNHPLVSEMISQKPEHSNATVMSVLANGFRLDYVLSLYESAVREIWNQTLSLK